MDKRGLVGRLGGWNKWRGRGNVGRSTGSAECHSDSIWHTLDQLVGGRVEDWGKYKKEQQKLQFRKVKHLLPQATFTFIFYQYHKNCCLSFLQTLCSEVSSIIMAQNTSQSIPIRIFRCKIKNSIVCLGVSPAGMNVVIQLDYSAKYKNARHSNKFVKSCCRKSVSMSAININCAVSLQIQKPHPNLISFLHFMMLTKLSLSVLIAPVSCPLGLLQ